MTQDQDVNNYTDDGILVQHILDDLRTNVLSTGQEYDSSSLTSLIKSRYPGATPAIIKSVIDTIFSDAENMKARVAGTFPEFQVLISARNPNLGFGKPAQPATLNTNQQQLQQQPQRPVNNHQIIITIMLSPLFLREIQAKRSIHYVIKINRSLAPTAQSVVNGLLPRLQDPIDSKDLENPDCHKI